MFAMPLAYDMPLYRPPSEAGSLILQVTLGCSWNRCSFCEMYTSKKFRPRKTEDVLAEIERLRPHAHQVDKVFLADGNATVLSNRRLLPILEALTDTFPHVRQISSYAMPSDLDRRSVAELKELRDAGLSMVYVGVETGDPELLKRVDKGETTESIVSGLQKAGEAGIRRSCMILNGLGGKEYSTQHSENSAKLINLAQPEFLATLVVSFPLGEQRFRETFAAQWTPLDQTELFAEEANLLRHLELNDTQFRSNHASNYLVLKGVLNQDRETMLCQLQQAIDSPDQANLRPEWARGL